MQVRYSLVLGAMLGAPAFAAGLAVNVEIPRLTVAEYHRPYVAVWVERDDQSVVGTLAVWYELNNKNAEGAKWLKDMRQWWRRTGRELQMPIDGVTSPTRPAGKHQVNVNEGSKALSALPAGAYKLVVEAVREVGGRELVTIPFQWPAKKTERLRGQGSSELGAVTLELRP